MTIISSVVELEKHGGEGGTNDHRLWMGDSRGDIGGYIGGGDV